jgi:hypothetical protein
MDATQVYVSEFIGTAVLMAFGSSCNASLLLKNTITSAIKTNWIGLMFGWGFAVTFAVYTAISLGGVAHLNPAITVAFAAGGLFPQELVIGAVIAQLLGGFLEASITILHYYPHFKITSPEEGNCVGIFATGPAIDHRGWNLLSEIIATFLFIFCVLLLGPMVNGLAPLIIGFLVASIGFSFGGTTGFALNPARDLPSRLAYAILPVPNKGTANLGYAWVPIVGPMIGGFLAVGAFIWLKAFLNL